MNHPRRMFMHRFSLETIVGAHLRGAPSQEGKGNCRRSSDPLNNTEGRVSAIRAYYDYFAKKQSPPRRGGLGGAFPAFKSLLLKVLVVLHRPPVAAPSETVADELLVA